MNPRFRLGETGGIRRQEERNGGGGGITRAEENQGNLRGVREGNGGVITPSPHGDSTWDSHVADPGGRHWQMGDRYIRSVLLTGVEVGGMSSGKVPGKGNKPGKTQRTLHVLALEVKGGDPTVGFIRKKTSMLSPR